MDNINIVSVTTNRHVIIIATLLKSLEYNHKSSETINVHILYKDVTTQNINKINDSINSDKINLIWYEITDEIINNLHFKDAHFLFTPTYYRLLIEYIIPSDIDRVLYLDADIIFNKDISELWNIDIGDNIIGAVRDGIDMCFKGGSSWKEFYVPIENYNKLGFTGDEAYFNAGVMLINLDMWRSNNTSQKILDFNMDNMEDVRCNDQYGANIILANDWFQLPDRWNVLYDWPGCTFSHPFGLHFIGQQKPYDPRFIPPYWNFDKYLNMTAWGGLNIINVICGCDDNHSELLATMIKSMESNHSTKESIVVNILNQNISDENKEKVANSLNPDNDLIRLVWHQVTDELKSNLQLDEEFEFTPHYYKLLAPYILPPVVNRVIYLDSDLILNTDISELWNIDIGNYMIGAVQDQYVMTVNGVFDLTGIAGIKNHKELGFIGDEKYFNSGAMIINLDIWNEEGMSQKIIDVSIEHREHIQYYDQYAFNVLLSNDWFELESNWNVFYHPHEEDDANIVHFVGGVKPIDDDFGGPDWDFFKYHNQTGFLNGRSGIIDIATMVNPKHVILLATMLKSLDINHFTKEVINVHILHENVSDEDKFKISKGLTSGKITLNWYSVEDISHDIPSFDDLPKPHIKMSKLLMVDVLPPEIEKLLYIDSDTIIVDDISNLWNTDIGSNIIGAVRDQWLRRFKSASWSPDIINIPNYDQLGFTGDEEYFNSGVMIINLNAWRAENISQQVFDISFDNIEYIKHHDQYGLNIVFANKWFKLEPRWNVFLDDWVLSNRPRLIHFAGNRKPRLHPLFGDTAIFDEYYKQTEFGKIDDKLCEDE